MKQNTAYIVVPVYNMEAFLPRCVDSLLGQSYHNFHIVLVNDGSKDASAEICDRYARADDRITVIHKPNGGLSDARNTGIIRCLEMSRQPELDYLALVDSDDFVHEDYLKELIRLCEENDCDGAQCNFEAGSADQFTSVPGAQYSIRLTDGYSALLDHSVKTLCPTKLYRMSIYKDILFPIGRLNEDEFTTYRLLYKCKKFAITPQPLYYYYQRPGSIMTQMRGKLRDNPRRYDWLLAFVERAAFFEALGDRQQVQRAYEKVCTELILRYTEQMALAPDQRDRAIEKGEYIRAYRNAYRKMGLLKAVPPMRMAVYTLFYFCPSAAVAFSRIRPLRQ